MNHLISILRRQNIKYNLFYKSYEIKDDSILIKRTNASYSSALEVKEMATLFELFNQIKGINFVVLKNGDICINKLK